MASLPSYFPSVSDDIRKEDTTFFKKHLSSFVPPNSFDAHAHLYTIKGLNVDTSVAPQQADSRLGLNEYRQALKRWMGELAPRNGLFFPVPTKNVDTQTENNFLASELVNEPDSRKLMIIRPDDDPALVESILKKDGFAGFKVYHLLANEQDTFNLPIGAYLSEWAWQLANKYSLSIMLHMVRSTALADPVNHKYIRAHCQKYSNAKLILAHAARGFSSHHTVDAIKTLWNLDNVFFDTSAVCESASFQAIIQTCGVSRLMFGTDWWISNLRGRCANLAYGFFWMYANEIDITTVGSSARPTLVGIESLLALKQAARLCSLTDSDVENIFCHNARRRLEISNPANNNQDRYKQAKAIIPGGTQLLSKRPEMLAPGCWPSYFKEANGCRITDIDGRQFIDMSTMGIGSCLLGYADPDITSAVHRRISLGAMATLNSPEEVELAELLIEIHPWAQQVRFARTGGEAMAVAVRIARAATGRDNVAICGYHGWHDWYLAANLSQPNQSGDVLGGHLLPGLEPVGVPRGLAGTTKAFRYNDIASFNNVIDQYGDTLAAVVMEPTRSEHPKEGFLVTIKFQCQKHGIALIIDEITAGWRLWFGGAHMRYGIEPDIAVFAKALGNGHPIAAVIGKKKVMSGAQQSFISSTYWTEGVGPTAALATIYKMRECNVPGHIQKIGESFQSGMNRLAKQHSLPLCINGHPALTHLSFDHNLNLAMQTYFTQGMLRRGFLAGAGFYPCLAHESVHVDRYLQQADNIFGELALALERGDLIEQIGGETAIRHSGFARLT